MIGSADADDIIIFALLVLSFAFGSVNQDILPAQKLKFFARRLWHGIQLNGVIYQKPSSNSSFCGQNSCRSTLTCGIPQEPDLGPTLFTFYTSDVIHIAHFSTSALTSMQMACNSMCIVEVRNLLLLSEFYSIALRQLTGGCVIIV